MNLSTLLGPIENENPKSAASRKVILWGPDDLFAQAIESFLETRKTLKVIRILAERGEDYFVEQVDALCPTVVILYIRDRAPDKQLLVRILQNQPDLKVVMVSEKNNRVQVLQKQNVILQDASELLSIIEN